MIFPGIGWLAFMITLYKIADMCCKQKEMFEQDCTMGGEDITLIVQLFTMKQN